MTKEEKFAQEVAHLLGRANAMKSEIVSNYYDVRSSESPIISHYTDRHSRFFSSPPIIWSSPSQPAEYRISTFTDYRLDCHALLGTHQWFTVTGRSTFSIQQRESKLSVRYIS